MTTTIITRTSTIRRTPLSTHPLFPRAEVSFYENGVLTEKKGYSTYGAASAAQTKWDTK